MAGQATGEGRRLTDSGLVLGQAEERQPGFEKLAEALQAVPVGLRSTLDSS